MQNDVRKRSMSVALVITAILALFVPMVAEAQEILPGPPTVLPDYIGAPAKAHPTPNSGVPQNPYLAPNPFNTVHVDPWMSDTVDIAGALGRDPKVLSSTLAEARNDPKSKIFQCVGAAFDSHGHLITPCVGTGPSGPEGSVVLADAKTLEVLDHYHLAPPSGTTAALSSCYWYFDNQERFTIADGPNKIITLVEGGSEAHPVLELPEGNTYDLSALVPDDDHISGVITDWQGRIWFVTSGHGSERAMACVLDPVTKSDAKCVPLGENDSPDGHEQIWNTFAVTKTGAYIVTSEKMYRVWAGSDDNPYVVWSDPYQTTGKVRPGQYELGSGTSPTILGEGKYVAITDNAETMHVVVFRTDKQLAPNEQKVCEVPVFEDQEGGALSNSLIGSRLSLIVENNYDYAMDWQQDGKKPSAPGFERIDINPNGKGCTKVWSNPDVTSTVSGKLSTRTGLIYIYARKMDTSKVDVEHPYGLDVYYLTALDFRTGEVVWEKQVGTGFAFDNWYAALLVGPDETVYFGLYGGLVTVRDTR